MTTINAIRLASLVTALNVLVASGFSIAAIIRPQYLVPAGPFQRRRRCYWRCTRRRAHSSGFVRIGGNLQTGDVCVADPGSLAGAMQLLDAGIGLFEHDLGKCAGPLFIAVLQFFVVYLLHRSLRITPQTKRG